MGERPMSVQMARSGLDQITVQKAPGSSVYTLFLFFQRVKDTL